jgi:hypothetical protein
MRHAGARAMGEDEARARLWRQCQQRGDAGGLAGRDGQLLRVEVRHRANIARMQKIGNSRRGGITASDKRRAKVRGRERQF